MENKPSTFSIRNGIIVICICALLIFLTLYFSGYFDNAPIKTAEKEAKAIQTEIDSLQKSHDGDRQKLTSNSQARAEKSKQITNSINHEKPIIPDTTYAAMCDFITNYRAK